MEMVIVMEMMVFIFHYHCTVHFDKYEGVSKKIALKIYSNVYFGLDEALGIITELAIALSCVSR